MGWTPITYMCGHEGREQRYGKHSDRDSYAAWCATNKLCPDCYAAERDKARAAENEAAKIANAAANLPSLTGSDKQIAWAESIRAKQLADPIIGDAVRRCISLAPDTYREARQWIDTRDRDCTTWWAIGLKGATWADARRECPKSVLADMLSMSGLLVRGRVPDIIAALKAWAKPSKATPAQERIAEWLPDIITHYDSIVLSAAETISAKAADAAITASRDAAEAKRAAGEARAEKERLERDAAMLRERDKIDMMIALQSGKPQAVIAEARRIADLAVPRVDGEPDHRRTSRARQFEMILKAEAQKTQTPYSIIEWLLANPEIDWHNEYSDSRYNQYVPYIGPRPLNYSDLLGMGNGLPLQGWAVAGAIR